MDKKDPVMQQSHVQITPHSRCRLASLQLVTKQVYNLFQEPMEQPPLGFSIAEEKNYKVFKKKQVKKIVAPSAPSNLFPNLLPNVSPDLLPNHCEQRRSNLFGFLYPYKNVKKMEKCKFLNVLVE